jgi:hypothetical protein
MSLTPSKEKKFRNLKGTAQMLHFFFKPSLKWPSVDERIRRQQNKWVSLFPPSMLVLVRLRMSQITQKTDDPQLF